MIEILDRNFRKIDILRKYTFSQYPIDFREIGSFTIHARAEGENLRFLNKSEQYYFLFDSRYIGKLESVSKSSDSEYDRVLILTGRMSFVLFTKRVCYGILNYSGYTYGFIKTLVETNITNDPESKRYVDIDISIEDEEYLKQICGEVDKQVTGGYVWDEMQEVMNQDRLGIEFLPVVSVPEVKSRSIDTNIKSWKLKITGGKDRRKGNTQGNVPVIFSQSLSNIERTDYSVDRKQLCNVAYVAGEGEGENRKWFEVYQSEQEQDKTAWDREELWIDARDVQSGQESGEMPDEQYAQLIDQRAQEKFKDNSIKESYTATIAQANKQYQYGVDYNIGDIVTVIDDELGISVDAQVTRVWISEQDSFRIQDVEFTYGSIRKDINDQIKVISESVEVIKNNIKYIEQKDKNISYIHCASDPNSSLKGEVKIPLAIESISGNDFKIDGTGKEIEVVGDVKQVHISATIGMGAGSSGRGWLYLYVSHEGTRELVDYDLVYGVYVVVKGNVIVDVKKGDTIFMYASEANGISIEGLTTWLTVTKLK